VSHKIMLAAGATDSIVSIYADEFVMACLFTHKLHFVPTFNLLRNNFEWRIKNGFSEIPKIDMNIFRYFIVKPYTRTKSGHGILYLKFLHLVLGKISIPLLL